MNNNSKGYNHPDNPFRYLHDIEDSADAVRNLISASDRIAWSYGTKASVAALERTAVGIASIREALAEMERIVDERKKEAGDE